MSPGPSLLTESALAQGPGTQLRPNGASTHGHTRAHATALACEKQPPPPGPLGPVPSGLRQQGRRDAADRARWKAQAAGPPDTTPVCTTYGSGQWTDAVPGLEHGGQRGLDGGSEPQASTAGPRSTDAHREEKRLPTRGASGNPHLLPAQRNPGCQLPGQTSRARRGLRAHSWGTDLPGTSEGSGPTPGGGRARGQALRGDAGLSSGRWLPSPGAAQAHPPLCTPAAPTCDGAAVSNSASSTPAACETTSGKTVNHGGCCRLWSFLSRTHGPGSLCLPQAAGPASAPASFPETLPWSSAGRESF